MKFREIELPSGMVAFMGKNADNNDELMKKFKGKKNVILHTVAPGSPFCVVGELNPSKKDVEFGAIACAFYSQDWKKNKKDIKINVFSGKEVSKRFWMKSGTWKVKHSKTINVKKKDILSFGRKRK
jgi:predicted ribosome quality control (RQC) complex YloA/Tae2 family protein